MDDFVRTLDDMDCAQLRHLLLEGDPSTRRSLGEAAARQHLADCPACAALALDGGQLAAELARANPSPAEDALSFDDLAAELVQERRWWARGRSLPTVARWWLAALGLAVPAGLALLRRRANLVDYPPGRFGAELAVLAIAAILACAIWLRPLYRPALRPGTVLVVLAVALALPWLLAALPPAGGVSVTGGTTLVAALTCLGLGTAFALPASLLLGAVGRRPDNSVRVLLPATAAALAGLVALAIHCPITDRGHLLGGHASLAVLLPAAALLASLGWRRRRGPPTTGTPKPA